MQGDVKGRDLKKRGKSVDTHIRQRRQTFVFRFGEKGQEKGEQETYRSQEQTTKNKSTRLDAHCYVIICRLYLYNVLHAFNKK